MVFSLTTEKGTPGSEVRKVVKLMNFKNFNDRLVNILETGMTHSLTFELSLLSKEEKRELINLYQKVSELDQKKL